MGPRPVPASMEKRRIPCTYRESKHSSVVQPVTQVLYRLSCYYFRGVLKPIRLLVAKVGRVRKHAAGRNKRPQWGKRDVSLRWRQSMNQGEIPRYSSETRKKQIIFMASLKINSWRCAEWTLQLWLPVSSQDKIYRYIHRETCSLLVSQENMSVFGWHEMYLNTLRTGLLNCLNARSRGLNFRHRASCI